MKDLSYLNAFNHKVIRSVRRILNHGITVEDIDRFLNNDSNIENASPERKAQFVKDMKERGWELKKPCGDCKEEKKRKS